MIQTHLPEFFTATILNWQNLLADARMKNIIIESLKFLTVQNKVIIYGFVIMPNHIHLIWQVQPDHLISDVQRDFLKYTSQQFLKILRNQTNNEIANYYVGKKDRKYQIWKRNSFAKQLYSEQFFNQKLEYIHQNPCHPKWNLVAQSEDYPYSSAAFYFSGIDNFNLLANHNGS